MQRAGGMQVHPAGTEGKAASAYNPAYRKAARAQSSPETQGKQRTKSGAKGLTSRGIDTARFRSEESGQVARAPNSRRGAAHRVACRSVAYTPTSY